MELLSGLVFVLNSWFALPVQHQQPGVDSVVQLFSNAAAPARVRIIHSGRLKTVATSNGVILRGAAISISKSQIQSGEADYATDPAHWDKLRLAGLNAVRLVVFDPWQASHGTPGTFQSYPAANFFKASDTALVLNKMEAIINIAAQRGMYVMINYHDTGGFRDPDYSQPVKPDGSFPYLRSFRNIRRFWSVVGHRFGERTNVIFELTNEPVRWFPEDYHDSELHPLKIIYDDVRRIAPRTHLVLCSFANFYSFQNATVFDVARRLRRMGVNFSNASIAVHPYNPVPPLSLSSQPLQELGREFPVLNTEQNFPQGVVVNSFDPDARGLDGDWLGIQSMERLGIGWFQWNTTTPFEFNQYFLRYIVPDARSKSYYWIK